MAAGRCGLFVFYAFDLLYLDGYDVRECALVDRKRVLAELLKSRDGPLQVSEHLEVDGAEMLRSACELELEGVFPRSATAFTARVAQIIG